VLVRPIAVSNVWMIGILNNDWKGIREETVVPKLKNCAYVIWKHGGKPLIFMQGLWYKRKRRSG